VRVFAGNRASLSLCVCGRLKILRVFFSFFSFHFAFARSLHFLVAVSYFSFSIDCRNIFFKTEKKPEESMMGEANGHGDNNLACVDMSSPDLITTAARLRQVSFLPSSNYLLSFKEKRIGY
jgi:hypothetical protein